MFVKAAERLFLLRPQELSRELNQKKEKEKTLWITATCQPRETIVLKQTLKISKWTVETFQCGYLRLYLFISSANIEHNTKSKQE